MHCNVIAEFRLLIKHTNYRGSPDIVVSPGLVELRQKVALDTSELRRKTTTKATLDHFLA